MPTYCYICPKCDWRMEESRTMEMAQFRPVCPMLICDAVMERDYRTENAGGITDKDYNQADINRYVQQVAENRQVDRPVLSKSLAMVPGIPKTKGPDGKTYATWRNKAERKRIFKQIGAVDLDS